MNGKPDIPYSAVLTMAILSRDHKLQQHIIEKAFGDMTHRFTAVLNSFDQSDLPFAVATMLICGNAVRNILPESGRQLVDKLTSMTSTVAIDMTELRRQAEEGFDGGNEER